MRLVHCRKCGTVVLTEVSLQERLIDEKEALMKEAKKAKSLDRQALMLRLGQVNRLLKQLNHSMRDDRQEIFTKLVTGELRKLGYDKQWFSDAEKQAEAEREKRAQQAQREIEKLYGEASDLLQNKSNTDPTARRAVNRVEREAER